jgi:hypothetical protein
MYRAAALAVLDAITVPSAEPAVPNLGTSSTFSPRLSRVIVTPSRSGVRASPAARSAELSMKNSSMPMLNVKLMRRNGRACALTSGAAFTRSSSDGAAKYPNGASSANIAIEVRNAW